MEGVEDVSRKAYSPLGTNLRVTIAANQGGRKYMEDRVHVHIERKLDKTIEYFFIGVFDGHGGFEASEFVRRHLLSNITKNVKFESKRDDDVLSAIREGFLLTHQQMQSVYDEWPHTPSGYPSTAGTTCSCVFLKNGKIYSGHVGDSAIFLGSKVVVEADDYEYECEQITTDHKPECEKEHARIRSAGGDVAIKSGISRVVWKRALKGHQFGPLRRNTPTETIPFLSVARSLGDLWSYCEETKEFVVSPDPDVSCRVIKPENSCIIIASDGLTNVLQAREVTSTICIEEKVSARHAEQPNHARALMKSVLSRWGQVRADNVTVAVVMLDDPQLREDETNMHMRLGQYSAVDQILTEQPDAMLQLTPSASYVLKTVRTPVIYNGSMDPSFSRINYRGPGFRTHEEELLEEERCISHMVSAKSMEVQEEEEMEEDLLQAAAASIVFEENKLFMKTIQKTFTVSPRKEDVLVGSVEQQATTSNTAVIEDSEGTDEENEASTAAAAAAAEAAAGAQSVAPPEPETPPMFLAEATAKIETPSSSARVKKTAIRRLRTPKMVLEEEEDEQQPHRPVTRSVSSAGGFKRATLMSTRKRSRTCQKTVEEVTTPNRPKKKTFESPEKTTGYAIVTRRRTITASVVIGVKHNPNVVMSPETPVTPKATTSRKRGRPVGSIRSSKRLQEQLLNTPGCPRTPQTGVTPHLSSLAVESPFLTRSAPNTPNKEALQPMCHSSKWSLSKLDQMTEEVQEDDGDEEEETTEPPSKMRKFYKFVTTLVGFKGASGSRGKAAK